MPRAARARRRQAQRRRAPSKRPRTGARALIFGSLALVVLAVAGYLLWPAFKSEGTADPNAIIVQPSMAGFSPSRLEARVGEPITVRLVNKDSRFHTDGGGWHQFAIDELGVNVKVAPTSTREYTFTPNQSGTFTFYCDVCCGGKESPSMQGTLVVRS